MNNEEKYEAVVKTFSVGDIVVYDKPGVEYLYVFEVREVVGKILRPMLGSVVTLERLSLMWEYRFSLPDPIPTQFMQCDCRKLVRLEEGEFREWVHRSYETAIHDEGILEAFINSSIGV